MIILIHSFILSLDEFFEWLWWLFLILPINFLFLLSLSSVLFCIFLNCFYFDLST